MRLHGIDRDGEIIREPGVAEKLAVPGKPVAKTAYQRHDPQPQKKKGHHMIDRRHGIQSQMVTLISIRGEQPLHCRPNEAEPGLQRGTVVGFGGCQFAKGQPKV